MTPVDVCPQNLTKVLEAAKKLGCGNDDYGKNQYLCLPNVNKTSLIEFCYKGTLGLQEKGFCLQVSEGKLTRTSCVGFLSGCPESPFITSDFYKYSACQELNPEHQCYKFDPHCPPKNDVETNDTPATICILVVYIGLVIFFIALFCILSFCRRRRKRRRRQFNAEDIEGEILKDNQEENGKRDPQLVDENTGHSEPDKSRKRIETREAKGTSLEKLKDATLKEMKKLLKEDREFTWLKNAVLSIMHCIEIDTETNDVYKNMQDVLQIGTRITQNLKQSISEVKATCTFLATVLQKDQYLLKNIKRFDDGEEYSELRPARTLGIRLEERLILSSTFFTQITEDTPSNMIDASLQIFSEIETVNVLERWQSDFEQYIRTSNVESAVLATILLNLYCRIAMLHSYVLWQVYCIKQSHNYDQSTTNGVFEIIDRCHKSSVNMLECLEHPKVDHAVFLTVFHITENGNVEYHLKSLGIKTHVVDESFYERNHYIQCKNLPDVKLQIKKDGSSIWGTTETTDYGKFRFESVEGREMDNICYIRSAHDDLTNHYIQMKSDGSCRIVKNRPDQGGKWKLVQIMIHNHPSFFISSLDWRGKFLYIESATEKLKGEEYFNMMERGLWKFREDFETYM
uniref:Uncharacterized protein LOC111102991 isoform X1 n=1 Tax=Crassostrea virginica TaxID=6565 RepID=A0A8B8AKG1_CRAVI|nr:uncharacterized protein LOC111102991 isoform X1 [Crassostrea virginica]